jgi:phosphate starvation-inducible PhoH-like protein
VSPKTEGQKFYVDAIRHHDIVFAIGPAGTGKTYLAMAMAVSNLFNKRSSASSWRVQPSKLGKSWDFCRATYTRR